MAVQLGAHPASTWRIAHLSDTHILADGALLAAVADTVGHLADALDQLARIGRPFDAVVVTGDLTDQGEPDAYRRLRELMVPAVARLGAQLCWVTGNHDDRVIERTELLGLEAADGPLDTVWWLDGLRIIGLDTSVPGFHHGELTQPQREWLAARLAEPAPDGTIIALHHAPIPSPLPLMDVLELRDQDALADVVRGSDVRAIIGGHLHYPTVSTFAGVPVLVAGAVSYTLDLSAPARDLTGIDGGQSFSIIDVYADRIVSSIVPIGRFTRTALIGDDYLTAIESLDEAGRVGAFSRLGGTLPAPE